MKTNKEIIKKVDKRITNIMNDALKRLIKFKKKRRH